MERAGDIGRGQARCREGRLPDRHVAAVGQDDQPVRQHAKECEAQTRIRSIDPEGGQQQREGTDEQWLKGLGTPLKSQLKQFTEDPEEVAAMIETYREYNHRHHDKLAKPYEGVVEEVRRIDSLGKTIGIVPPSQRASGC